MNGARVGGAGDERCRACGTRVPVGSRCRVLWGWVAALYCSVYVEEPEVEGCRPIVSGWCRPVAGARMVGVGTDTLSRWAGRGLITAVHCPGDRRYFQPELRVVAEMGEVMGVLNGTVLAAHVDIAMELGWR